MDNVPVKIAESYKPPPRLYQIPQTITNKLLLPHNHYQEAPQFQYDFQLERKVRTKMPEWRRVCELGREQRRERMEKREQIRLKLLEAQQKQMLGAVSYPSAEDLSSNESDDEEPTNSQVKNGIPSAIAADNMNSQLEEHSAVQTKTSATSNHAFEQILKPTILACNSNESTLSTTHSSNLISMGRSTSFNYKDFEEAAETPFDNIELKTINDLDILAQVLHNTQLKAEKLEDIDNNQTNGKASKENTVNDNVEKNVKDASPANDNILENAKATLEKVNFNIMDQYSNDIPRTNNTHAVEAVSLTSKTMQNYGNNLTNHITIMQQQQHMYMPYQQQQYTNYNTHHTQYLGLSNYGQQSPNHNLSNANKQPMDARLCNGSYSPSNSNSYYSASPQTNLHFESNFMPTNSITSVATIQQNNPYLVHTHQQQPNHIPKHTESENVFKSKSVPPDILKELKDELRNSEIRRSKDYKQLDDVCISSSANELVDSDKTPKNSPVNTIKRPNAAFTHGSAMYYAGLEASTQRLAKNISSMGFPLERVAKIAQLLGADDRKIVEHLIPLSELMDLGFEESKISDALVKFDNNKEKALEYLIS